MGTKNTDINSTVTLTAVLHAGRGGVHVLVYKLMIAPYYRAFSLPGLEILRATVYTKYTPHLTLPLCTLLAYFRQKFTEEHTVNVPQLLTQD